MRAKIVDHYFPPYEGCESTKQMLLCFYEPHRREVIQLAIKNIGLVLAMKYLFLVNVGGMPSVNPDAKPFWSVTKTSLCLVAMYLK